MTHLRLEQLAADAEPQLQAERMRLERTARGAAYYEQVSERERLASHPGAFKN